MSIAFYTGATGMQAFQSKLNVVAHNIANVNTYGYKSRNATFEDLLRSRINTNVEGEHLVGHGVKQENINYLMDQSSLDQTGFALDFAVIGQGFFAVDVNGQRQYTRNGAFDISVEGGAATLVSNDGAYVLDGAGNRITVPMTDGVLDTSGLKERIGVFGFNNPYGLEPHNNARFAATDASGAAQVLTQNGQAGTRTYVLEQFALENSGVELSKEMVEVINAQRAFQMNSRVVQTADQIMEVVNNLR